MSSKTARKAAAQPWTKSEKKALRDHVENNLFHMVNTMLADGIQLSYKQIIQLNFGGRPLKATSPVAEHLPLVVQRLFELFNEGRPVNGKLRDIGEDIHDKFINNFDSNIPEGISKSLEPKLPKSASQHFKPSGFESAKYYFSAAATYFIEPGDEPELGVEDFSRSDVEGSAKRDPKRYGEDVRFGYAGPKKAFDNALARCDLLLDEEYKKRSMAFIRSLLFAFSAPAGGKISDRQAQQIKAEAMQIHEDVILDLRARLVGRTGQQTPLPA